MQEGNPNLGAREIDPADIPAEGNAAEPAGREWPTTLQGWREHYRGGGLTYAKAGYLRYSRSPEQGQAARERARALSGQMPTEQYESLFASPQLPADQPELGLGPAFQNPIPPRSAPLTREPADQPELALGPAFQNPNPPRSAPLNREPPDQPELELGPAFQNPESVPSEGGGPSPLVDWIGAARKTRGRSGVGGTGGIKAPPIGSQVPPEIPEALPAGPGLGMQMAGGAAAGAAGGLHGGMIEGVASGAIGGALMGGPVGAAVGAGVGLLTGALHDMRQAPGSARDFLPGEGTHGGDSGYNTALMAGVVASLSKIAGTRSRV